MMHNICVTKTGPDTLWAARAKQSGQMNIFVLMHLYGCSAIHFLAKEMNRSMNDFYQAMNDVYFEEHLEGKILNKPNWK